MAGFTHLVRSNFWLAIIVSVLATAGLIVIDQLQLAALLGSIAGLLLMWKSEHDNPSLPPEEV